MKTLLASWLCLVLATKIFSFSGTSLTGAHWNIKRNMPCPVAGRVSGHFSRAVKLVPSSGLPVPRLSSRASPWRGAWFCLGESGFKEGEVMSSVSVCSPRQCLSPEAWGAEFDLYGWILEGTWPPTSPKKWVLQSLYKPCGLVNVWPTKYPFPDGTWGY